MTSIRGAASAGYVAVGEVAPAVAGLGCRAKEAVVLGPGRGGTGLQVRPALCERVRTAASRWPAVVAFGWQ